MKNNSEKHNLYKAANLIATHCARQIYCFDCPFQINGSQCLLNKRPKDWPIFNEPQWSATDITLAKALHMMGYTHIVRGTKHNGEQIVQVQRMAPGILEIQNLPPDSFLSAEEGVYYDLERIQ